MNRMRGAASVEFYIVSLFVLIPFVMGILQIAVLYVGKNTLNHAVFMAARAAAMENGSDTVFRTALAKGLVPLYARKTDPITNRNIVQVITPAITKAGLDVVNPLRTRIAYLNPTRASFRDFEQRQNGVLQIPNDNLQFRPRTPGATSKQSIQEANLLKVRVDYCHELVFPLIDAAIVAILRRLDTDLFHQSCYRANRVPVSGRALLHMQSPARRSEMGTLN
jgi:hypothetical protein